MDEVYVPQEHPDYPGFYKIPGYSNYAVNKLGIVIRVVATPMSAAGSKVARCVGANGYAILNLKADSDTHLNTVSVNVVVCTAFQGPKPHSDSVAVCLFKMKHRYSYRNFKWGTQTEVPHFANPLQVNKRIFAYNIKKKQIFSDDHIERLAKTIGVNSDYIGRIAKGGHSKITGEWLFSYNEQEDWEALGKKLAPKVFYGHDVLTWQTVSAPSCRELAALTEIPEAAIYQYLKRKSFNIKVTWLFSMDANENWTELMHQYTFLELPYQW